MQNCLLIRDSHENENVLMVVIGDISSDEVDKIADECRSEDEYGDEHKDYNKFTEILKERGCTIYAPDFDDIIF